ncbi:rho guanine nucleotide exchange factor 10-like protein [Anopheles ziemanni]|uniref:rho guanine nucleotide exchange factor 10-like protein n=1 Tax=Anopheles coustani TaxID=139045 RepID=UPI002657F33F|nr:rho guanine nucleotide exchange factor 10-like protein [Anopheles coustani]XP_058176362.1 rho guanine nucleotide exchange factor 10-like protein [Anopheles ziemanni]
MAHRANNNGRAEREANEPRGPSALTRFLSFRLSPASVFRRSRIRGGSLPGNQSPENQEVSPPQGTNNRPAAIKLKPLPEPTNDHRGARWAVFNNFITYESNYMETLQFLTLDCYNELIKNDNTLHRSKTAEIFAYLPQIRKLHEHFQEWVATSADCWHVREISGWFFGAMLEQPALLMTYTMFVANYKRAVGVLKRELARNRTFRNFVESRLIQANQRQHSLESFLMRPIQRMIHFELQILDMMQQTPKGHPDMPLLEMCKRRVQYIVSQLDALEGHTGSLEGVLKSTFPGRFPSAPYACCWPETQVLRCENLHQTSTSRGGATVETILPLYLMTDRVLLTVVSDSTRAGRFEGKLNLKWMLPLQEIDFQTVFYSCADPPEPYMEMLHLMLDFATMSEIDTLVGGLHNSFDELSPVRVTGILDSFGAAIQKLNDDARKAEESFNSCELVLRTKKDGYYSGRGRKYRLQFEDGSAKRRWFEHARLAQRAMASSLHSSAWWVGQDQLFATSEPVFLGKFSPMFHEETSKITCGCYYEPNLSAPLYARLPLSDWLRHQNTLWLCSFEGVNTVVALYTHDVIANVLRPRTMFTLPDVLVESIVHVPIGMVEADDDSTIDTVWLGMQDQLILYSATYPLIDEPLLTVPIRGYPQHMLYVQGRVYVGLDDGKLLVFRIVAEVWNVDSPVVVHVSDAPISALLSIEDDVYVAAGFTVTVIDGRTDRVVNVLYPDDPESPQKPRPIVRMAHSVNGLWLVRCSSSIVSLYRPPPWMHQEGLDVGKHVKRAMPHVSMLYFRGGISITALQLVDDSLWIGTNGGVTLMVVLPARSNVPLVEDFVYAAKHGHMQSVSFLLPLLPASNNDVGDGNNYGAASDFPPDDEDSTSSYATAQAEVDTDSSDSGFGRSHTYTGTIPKQPRAPPELERKHPSPQSPGPSKPNVRRTPNWPAPFADSSSRAPATPGEGPATALIIVGGEGYANWYDWEQMTAGRTMYNSFEDMEQELMDDTFPSAQALLWEKRLNRPANRSETP